MSDFIVRVFKGWETDLIERAWSNSYEVISGDEDPAAIVPIAEAIVAAEKQLHLAQVHFMQYTISTWEPDSHPYDPSSFITTPFSDVGLRGGGAGSVSGLDYNVCLVVKRACATGRSGRLFYRGCLLELDVKMGGDGRFVIDNADAGALAAAFSAYEAELVPYIGVGAGDKIALIGAVAGSPGTVTRRDVVALTIGGITINKRNHRYFDRG